MLAENKIPLARDVIFLAEADEEGAHSTYWLAEPLGEADCEFALNEGGWDRQGRSREGEYVSISTADKEFGRHRVDRPGVDPFVDAASRQRHLHAEQGDGKLAIYDTRWADAKHRSSS